MLFRYIEFLESQNQKLVETLEEMGLHIEALNTSCNITAPSLDGVRNRTNHLVQAEQPVTARNYQSFCNRESSRSATDHVNTLDDAWSANHSDSEVATAALYTGCQYGEIPYQAVVAAYDSSGRELVAGTQTTFDASMQKIPAWTLNSDQSPWISLPDATNAVGAYGSRGYGWSWPSGMLALNSVGGY